MPPGVILAYRRDDGAGFDLGLGIVLEHLERIEAVELESRGQLSADLDRTLLGTDALGLAEVLVNDPDVSFAGIYLNDLDAHTDPLLVRARSPSIPTTASSRLISTSIVLSHDLKSDHSIQIFPRADAR